MYVDSGLALLAVMASDRASQIALLSTEHRSECRVPVHPRREPNKLMAGRTETQGGGAARVLAAR